MRNELRASPIVLAALLLAAACAGHGQRVSESATTAAPPAVPAPGVPSPPPTGTESLTERPAPIPGHPPVTMSGHLKSVDTDLGTISFEDGRTVMLSRESEVLVPASIDKVKRGIPIVVRNALPVAVWSQSVAGPDSAGAASAGKSQRVATVESIDESDQAVQLTDGSTLRVPTSARVHRGVSGPSIAFGDLRPGDELVIVTSDAAPPTTTTEPTPSASPRATESSATHAPSEVMVFSPIVRP